MSSTSTRRRTTKCVGRAQRPHSAGACTLLPWSCLGGEYLSVWQVDGPVHGIKADIGEADLGDLAFVLTAESARLIQAVSPTWNGASSSTIPANSLASVLPRSDAEERAKAGAAKNELRAGEAEQLERDRYRRDQASQH